MSSTLGFNGLCGSGNLHSEQSQDSDIVDGGWQGLASITSTSGSSTANFNLDYDQTVWGSGGGRSVSNVHSDSTSTSTLDGFVLNLPTSGDGLQLGYWSDSTKAHGSSSVTLNGTVLICIDDADSFNSKEGTLTTWDPVDGEESTYSCTNTVSGHWYDPGEGHQYSSYSDTVSSPGYASGYYPTPSLGCAPGSDDFPLSGYDGGLTYNFDDSQFSLNQRTNNLPTGGIGGSTSQGVLTDGSSQPLWTATYTFDSAGRVASITDANGSTTSFTYDSAGNLASLTDPDGNTTTWAYDNQNQVIQETDALGDSQYYTYDSAGDLTRYMDYDGRVRQYAYNPQHEVTTETWYADVADADAQENPENTIQYAYDSAGRIVSESDNFSSDTYTYDSQGNLVSTTESSPGGPTVVLNSQYDGGLSQFSSDENGTVPLADRTQLSASIDGTSDFVNDYTYDSLGQMTGIAQDGITGGNAVAEKNITLAYNANGQFTSIDRYLGSQLAVQSDYSYDSLGRLTGLNHHQGSTPLASYTFAWSGSSTGILPATVADNAPWSPSGGLPSSVGNYPLSTTNYSPAQGMLPVHDTTGIVDAICAGVANGSETSVLTDVESADGSVHYTYDPTGQLLSATYSVSNPQSPIPNPSSESYTWDANGNPTGSGYVVGADNRLLFDGTYTYTYDAEGNRTARFVDNNHDGVLEAGDTDITQYIWDNRNRLVEVTSRATFGGTPTQVVDEVYDVENRWIGETIMSPRPSGEGQGEGGNGTVDHQTCFAYDGNQIVLQFDKEGAGDMVAGNLSHRYLWGPAVDQLLADEQVTSVAAPGNVVWPLANQLGTINDLATTDAQSGVTSVVNHRVFDSFGNFTSQTNAAVDCLFGLAGRPTDEVTGLLNNRNRWCDGEAERWVSEDPIGFVGQDTNASRYVGNSPMNGIDPSGEVTCRQVINNHRKSRSDSPVAYWQISLDSTHTVPVVLVQEITLAYEGGEIKYYEEIAVVPANQEYTMEVGFNDEWDPARIRGFAAGVVTMRGVVRAFEYSGQTKTMVDNWNNGNVFKDLNTGVSITSGGLASARFCPFWNSQQVESEGDRTAYFKFARTQPLKQIFPKGRPRMPNAFPPEGGRPIPPNDGGTPPRPS